jgi:hypothetical protein
MRFQFFFWRLPDAICRNISSSAIGFTFGIGTVHLPAFSFRFCLTVFDRIFARVTFSLSSR